MLDQPSQVVTPEMQTLVIQLVVAASFSRVDRPHANGSHRLHRIANCYGLRSNPSHYGSHP